VHLLQIAMRDAGFHGLRSEWWHFTIADWQKYLPPEEAKRAVQALRNTLARQVKIDTLLRDTRAEAVSGMKVIE
jgi:hypothetical protein